MTTYFAMLTGVDGGEFSPPSQETQLIITQALIELQVRLIPEELIHSIEVGNTAAMMAAVYSTDVEQAFLAGLLHDWDKCTDPQELLAKAHQLGISVPTAARRVPKLLHAYTAAESLAERFPALGSEVLEAVRCHTIGEVGMGDLAQIVYVADVIEPNRTHGGVDSLREMVGTVDLRTLFTEAFERTIANLIADRKLIHPDTTEVWNWLVSGDDRK